MAKDISSHLLNRGNTAERQLGRLLKRGRLRHVPGMVQLALDTANQVLKDFGGAPASGAMQSGQTNTNTFSGSDAPKRKTRLKVPYSDE